MPKLSGQSMVCDSSALISLTDSCFVHALYFLKKKFRGSFLIPPSVEYECVEHPMKMKMHAIHALRLKRAIADRVVEVVQLSDQREVQEIKWLGNNLFYTDGTPIRLIQEGEIEVLALARQAGVQNLLVDERTVRMLSEDPEALRIHLEDEFHRRITTNEENLSAFSRLTKGMRFFRSSELLLLAYEKGYFADYKGLEQEAIEAALYKLKYAGCAVGFSEIAEYVGKHVRE
jgi:predicted nucleic acid-binding protein